MPYLCTPPHADLLSGKKSGIFQYNQKLSVNLKAANGVVSFFGRNARRAAAGPT
jgi:hypothetical protein